MMDIICHNDDALQRFREIADNSIDAVVTDPPYGILFMMQEWDRTSIAFDEAFWAECLRVAKPGSHLLAFGATRTYHHLAMAIEKAGWEIRDSIHWMYGSGFPKSYNIAQSIEKANTLGRARRADRDLGGLPRNRYSGSTEGKLFSDTGGSVPLTTDEAREWNGWGTALKPSHEPIVLARKPLSESTVAANVLKWRTGAINVDASRIGADGGGTSCVNRDENGKCVGHKNAGRSTAGETFHGPNTSGGRWPANSLFSCSCDDEHTDGCPVRMLDEQSGASKSPVSVTRGGKRGLEFGMGRQEAVPCYGDSGGASRFFYCAKPSAEEKNAGCEQFEKQNDHPTVKPVQLMRYLCRLVTPPNGVILDPFVGSGTTGVAAVAEGFSFIGIESDEKSFSIAQARLLHAQTTESVPKQKRVTVRTKGVCSVCGDRVVGDALVHPSCAA